MNKKIIKAIPAKSTKRGFLNRKFQEQESIQIHNLPWISKLIYEKCFLSVESLPTHLMRNNILQKPNSNPKSIKYHNSIRREHCSAVGFD